MLYQSLLGTILIADLVIKIMTGFGVIIGIVGFISLCSMVTENDIFRKTIIAGVCAIIVTGTIVVCQLRYFQPEYIVMQAVAPEVDKYISTNKDVIYNPEVALKMVNDTAFSMVQSIQTMPELIKKLSSMSSKELDAEQEKREFEEFRKWKASQNR